MQRTLFCIERLFLVITGYKSDMLGTLREKWGYNSAIFWDGWSCLSIAGKKGLAIIGQRRKSRKSLK